MADVAAAVRPIISQAQAGYYNLAAACAWVMYDYALTFADEVEYIWNKPIRVGSLLFFWIRYFGLGSLIFKLATSASTTTAVLRDLSRSPIKAAWAELLGLILIFSVQVILQARVYALFKSRLLAYFNGALFVADIILTLSLWGLSHPFRCTNMPFLDGCDAGYPLFWIPTTVFEAWIGALAMYKFVCTVRFARPVSDGVDVFSVFMRNSVVHYISVMLCVVIVNILGHLGTPADSGILQACVFIAGSRLVLHLRKAFFAHEDRTNISHKQSAIVFGGETQHKLSTLVDDSFWGGDDDQRGKRHFNAVQLTDF